MASPSATGVILIAISKDNEDDSIILIEKNGVKVFSTSKKTTGDNVY